MFYDIFTPLLNLIDKLGYLGVFLGMAIESTLVPLPSELVLIPAGYLAFQGKMSIFWLTFLGGLGSLTGAFINYYLALFLGRKLILKVGKYFFLSPDNFYRTELLVKKYGNFGTFIARLIPVVRHLIPIIAGLVKMKPLSFAKYTFLGASLWSFVLVLLGYFLGGYSHSNSHILHVLVGLFILCIFLIYLLIRVLKKMRSQLPKTLVITAGGTGGHIFPAVSLALDFADSGKNVLFITDERFKNYLNHHLVQASLLHNNITVQYIGIQRIKGFKSYIKLIGSVFRSLYILLRCNCPFIIGFGGYVTFPVLLAGVCISKNVIIHEQNAILGRVNQFFSYFAISILTTFKKTRGFNKFTRKKAVYSSLPLYKSLQNAIKQSKIMHIHQSDTLIITLIGGSQGSIKLSNAFKELILMMKNYYPDKKFEIYHQVASEESLEYVENFYKNANITAFVSRLFSNLPEILVKSHIVISRSGASSVFENCMLKKAVIYVPLPNSIKNHQLLNVQHLFEQGGCLLVNDNKDLLQNLFTNLKALFDEPNTYALIQNASYHFFSDAKFGEFSNLLTLYEAS